MKKNKHQKGRHYQIYWESAQEYCKYRNGICALFVASEDITSPRAERDLFIFWVSFNLSPCTSVLAILSLPARSISHSLLLVHSPFSKFSPFTITQCMLHTMHRISNSDIMCTQKKSYHKLWCTNQCDRLLCSFALVDPTALALLPVRKASQTSFILFTWASTSPGTWCIPSPSCFISSLKWNHGTNMKLSYGSLLLDSIFL